VCVSRQHADERLDPATSDLELERYAVYREPGARRERKRESERDQDDYAPYLKRTRD